MGETGTESIYKQYIYHEMFKKAVEEETFSLGIWTSLQNFPQNYDIRDQIKTGFTLDL